MQDNLKSILQDCNLNFLIGSGLSCPYFKTLGSIEQLLTDIEKHHCSTKVKAVVRASLYKAYFDAAIGKNLQLIAEDVTSNSVRHAYEDFLSTMNSLLLQRKSTILSKEVNLFTTNIDIFLEK